MIKTKHLILGICSLLGMLLVFLSASKYGPAISTDSVAYVHSAKTLLEGKGYVYFGYNTPFIQWPPLYPSLLALFISTGIEAWTAALYMNATIFGGIIFLSGLWLLKNTNNFLITSLGSLTVLFSVPLFHVSKYVWSEPLFILLTLLFFIYINKYIEKTKTLDLYLASIFASLAFLTRYTGVIVLITGCIVLLIQKSDWVKKIKRVILFGLISGFPSLLWIIRNYIVSETLMGARTPSNYTLIQNINFTWRTLIAWFVPHQKLKEFVSLGIIPAFIFAIIILGISIFAAPIIAGGLKKSEKFSNILKQITAPAIFIILYIPYLIVSASSVAFDTIDDRLMSPVFIPIILTVFCIVAYYIDITDSSKIKKRYTFFVMVTVSLMLIYPIFRVTHNIKQSINYGAGVFSVDRWHNSSLIDFIKKEPPHGPIYSNNPDAIYAISGIPAMYTPKKNSLPEYGLERFKALLGSATSSYIIWFNENSASTIYNVEELGNYFDVELVNEFSDGKVYVIIDSK